MSRSPFSRCSSNSILPPSQVILEGWLRIVCRNSSYPQTLGAVQASLCTSPPALRLSHPDLIPCGTRRIFLDEVLDVSAQGACLNLIVEEKARLGPTSLVFAVPRMSPHSARDWCQRMEELMKRTPAKTFHKTSCRSAAKPFDEQTLMEVWGLCGARNERDLVPLAAFQQVCRKSAPVAAFLGLSLERRDKIPCIVKDTVRRYCVMSAGDDMLMLDDVRKCCRVWHQQNQHQQNAQHMFRSVPTRQKPPHQRTDLASFRTARLSSSSSSLHSFCM